MTPSVDPRSSVAEHDTESECVERQFAETSRKVGTLPGASATM
ncbi:hypothetical protein PAMC26577_11990 [Caballeronia sordidicola]|uniref:Uncharacterized protein n=1 Tax=Caballeronia sordidicola TaxID=196367 RepID=A0A242MXL8_CABSO|nr:hypothetical protein PAMC26577_11990 [Caballeronia sordidicola]